MIVMTGRSSLVAPAEQKAALQALSRSDVRGKADRARAILLTLEGWTSPQVAQAFSVTADAVRHWRGWFQRARGGRAALDAGARPAPAKGERALEVASLLLRQPVEDRTNRTLPRLRAEIERQTGAAISTSHLSAMLKGGASAGVGPGTA